MGRFADAVRSGDIQSTVLDRAIEWFSPTWGEKRSNARSRMQARSLHDRGRRSGYEGASRGQRWTGGWMPMSGDANAVASSALDLLRQRSRDVRRNIPWASRAIDIIATDSVATGIVPQPMTTDNELAAKWLELWNEWAGSTQCDPDGQLNFYAMQDLAVQSIAEAGEVLARFETRSLDVGLKVPLQIRLLEADHIDTGKTDEGALQGIAIKGGRRAGFYLFPEHPGQVIQFGKGHPTLESKLYSSDDILHSFVSLRPGQLRGIPWAAPCLVRVKDFDEFEDTESLRQKLAACYVGTVYSEHGFGGPSTDGAVPEEFEPGMIAKLPVGARMELSTPPPYDGYRDYADISLRAIAGCYKVTFEALTQDLKGANFTRARMGGMQHFREVARFQSLTFIPQFCTPVWRRFVTAAIAAGHNLKPVGAHWTPSKPGLVDPVREITGIRNKVRLGVCSLQGAIRELGYDPRTVLEELKSDRELAAQLNLVLEAFPENDLGREDEGTEIEEDPDERDEKESKKGS